MKNRLYRSESDKKIAGVCGGIAEYFGIDSTIIRLIWTISIAVYGTGLLVYIIAAIIMPTKEKLMQMNMHQDSDEINKQKNSIFDGDFDKEKNKILGVSTYYNRSNTAQQKIYSSGMVKF